MINTGAAMFNLIKATYNKNFRPDYYNQKLITAIENNDCKKIKKYIQHGANVNVRSNGVTALMLTIQRGLDESVNDLINAGAEVNAYSAQEWLSPLMLAAKSGKLDIIRTLLASGANVNAVDYQGATALMYAAWLNHFDIVKELVKVGANISLKTNQGKTAFSLTLIDFLNPKEWTRYREIVVFLEMELLAQKAENAILIRNNPKHQQEIKAALFRLEKDKLLNDDNRKKIARHPSFSIEISKICAESWFYKQNKIDTFFSLKYQAEQKLEKKAGPPAKNFFF